MSSRQVDSNGVPYWGRDLARRIDHIEQYEPAVMASELKNLREELQSLRRAFYTFAFGVVASSIVFAFSVFALLGRG